MAYLLRLWLCALVLATACSACDETAAGVQRDYVTRHSDSFVYEIPRAQLLAALADLLADKGLKILDAPPDATTLHTTRVRQGASGDVEYSIHLLPLRAGGTLVQLVYIAHDEQGNILVSQRDDDLEWQLVQRAEPDRALAIMSTANGRADHVAPRAHRLP